MISRQMRLYNYSVYTPTLDEYGQETLVASNGQIKMAINITAQNNQDNVLYSNATYIGLTNDENIDDTYVIALSDTEQLKVLYINTLGRLKQIFMAKA